MTSVAASLPGPRGPTLRPPRIVICDPSAKTRTVIRAIVGAGRETVLVEGAAAAWEALHAGGVDVLITDTALGDEDGLELCRRIRATPALAPVGVIIVTSVANDDSRLLGLECGADDYLFKPLRPRELRARVEALLRLRRATLALEARTGELEAAHHRLSQTQTALFQAEKLALIGTLVAGVAHEINNPLAYIKAGLGSLQEVIERLGAIAARTDGAAEAAELTAEGGAIVLDVTEGAARLERISRELKLMAIQPDDELQEVELTSELTKAWRIARLRARVDHQLALSVSLSRPLLSVPHLLSQVILNLFINAVQAMGDRRGTITCATEAAEDELALVIADTGPGIPEGIAARVFDPFFTTKPVGEGTGLGLAISRAIVESLGGRLELSSLPGQGATFTLRLPWARPMLSEAPAGPDRTGT